MANPRRPTNHHTPLPTSIPPPLSDPIPTATLLSFLKKPHAFPFLLSLFLLLTWLSLRFHASPRLAPRFALPDSDSDANIVRFSAVRFPSRVFRDRRGWMVDPVVVAREAGIDGGAQSCVSVHVGEIRPGGVRGNHRHHSCNETFIIWGAETKFRLENPNIEGKGYAEVTIGAEEVVVAASPSGTAHALVNIDSAHTTFFMGCQDTICNSNNSRTDYNVWKEL